MKRVRLTVLFIILGFTVGSCGPSSGGGCQQVRWFPPSGNFVGKEAPNFILSDLSGEKIELSHLAKEKPTLLIFWATWCPSCVEEIPILKEWSQKYSDLQIIGVNIQESAERVKRYAEKMQIRYPILLDEEGEVAHDYGLVGIPAAVFLAKNQKIIYYGFSLPPNLEQLIKVANS